MRPTLDWNLVVTARSGRRHDLVYVLRPILRLRHAGFPDVSIGRAADVEACLAGIAGRAEGIVGADILARVVPVTRTFLVDAAELEAQLVAETVPCADALVGRSFHVRVERRGQRPVARSDVLERRLGTALVDALRARGAGPRVTFEDPDVIVAVELIGPMCGIGLVDRELRRRFPFVRVC
jgi:adenylyl- and sulfurtransferase ThiI